MRTYVPYTHVLDEAAAVIGPQEQFTYRVGWSLEGPKNVLSGIAPVTAIAPGRLQLGSAGTPGPGSPMPGGTDERDIFDDVEKGVSFAQRTWNWITRMGGLIKSPLEAPEGARFAVSMALKHLRLKSVAVPYIRDENTGIISEIMREYASPGFLAVEKYGDYFYKYLRSDQSRRLDSSGGVRTAQTLDWLGALNTSELEDVPGLFLIPDAAWDMLEYVPNEHAYVIDALHNMATLPPPPALKQWEIPPGTELPPLTLPGDGDTLPPENGAPPPKDSGIGTLAVIGGLIYLFLKGKG
jgi:hypothetical protein